MVKRTLKMTLCDWLVRNLFWFLIIYTLYLGPQIFSTVVVLNKNLNAIGNKAIETSPKINITKFKLNHSLDNKSTYSSSSSHFTSSSSSASSSSSSSSSESQANEDVLATSDVSLGAQLSNGALMVSDELLDSGLETRTENSNKLDKNKFLIELTTTEVNLNLKQTTSIGDNLSVNDVLLQEDDYLHQHLDQTLNQHSHLLNDYLIADIDKSNDFKSSYKIIKDGDKLNNEPIIYSSSSNRPLDTGHAVFTPIQPPPPSTIDLDSNQPSIPDFPYPLDFNKQDSNNLHSATFNSTYKSSNVYNPTEGSKKEDRTPKQVGVCKDGLVVPAWRPLLNLTKYDRILRGLVYFLVLSYLFVGVSIIADRFMAAIEVGKLILFY